jgi:hypothetical protein
VTERSAISDQLRLRFREVTAMQSALPRVTAIGHGLIADG